MGQNSVTCGIFYLIVISFLIATLRGCIELGFHGILKDFFKIKKFGGIQSRLNYKSQSLIYTILERFIYDIK